jgi:hypothetical protein
MDYLPIPIISPIFTEEKAIKFGPFSRKQDVQESQILER